MKPPFLLLLALSANALQAASLIPTDVDEWSVARDNNVAVALVITDGSTSSPSFGDATSGSNNLSNVSMAGTWGSTATIDIGETFSVSGTISWSDDLANIPGQLRLGLYNSSAAAGADGGFTWQTNGNTVRVMNYFLRLARMVSG